MPYYLNVNNDGLKIAINEGDGYTIQLKWYHAYPSLNTHTIGYNIYMGSGIAPDFPWDFFLRQPAFVNYQDGYTSVDIIDLIPGQMYHFGVRAFEYDATQFNFDVLPQTFNGLVTLPQSLLSADITATDGYIPLIDVAGFPISGGTIRIGVELIQYSFVDSVDSQLVLLDPGAQRGYLDTLQTFHDVDGYDGYNLWPPEVQYFPIEIEERNTRVFECWCRFDIHHWPYTVADGYHQRVKDILTTPLVASDANNLGFPAYDYSGYHSTPPSLLFNGSCVGSYIGGRQGCADGYGGVGNVLSGFNIQTANEQRQEVLLSLTGEPVVLMRRSWTGITCKCMLPYNEYPEQHCPHCYGTGFVVGWQQVFDSRRSDGRIMVRFSPVDDDLTSMDAGLESILLPNCWTGGWISIKGRDFIVRYDQDGNEEFRYEVLRVQRNKMFFSDYGSQHFALQRVRKTDPIYLVPITDSTAMYPMTLETDITNAVGIGPHAHTFVISEQIVSVSQIDQTTGIAGGHNHSIVNGVVLESLDHTHELPFTIL